MENSETRVVLIKKLIQSLEILRLSADQNKLEIDELIEEISQLQLEEVEERMFDDIVFNNPK